jgi:hypothetical protein
LAKSSLDPKDAENSSLEDLTPSELSTLDEWAVSYASKYDLVGYIKTPGASGEATAATNSTDAAKQ